MVHRFALLLVGLFSFAACAVSDQRRLSADDFVTFERKIRPLLSEHCFSCHSAQAKTVHGGLRLDTASDVGLGGDSGPVILAGEPLESLLIETVRYDGDIQMPPKGKLPESDIAELTKWVKQGARFPPSPDQSPRRNGKIDFAEGRKFWSFQPLQKQSLPKVDDTSWPRNRIDSFALAAMEREGLTPSPMADRATLIRRICFDLIGLPPTPE